METKTFVGLDVHRNLVVATAINSKGKPIQQSSFGPSPRELSHFLKRLPRPTKVAIEACHIWERFYRVAVSTGAEVVLSNPLRTRMIAESSIKTDKVDSATLSNLLRLDSLPLIYIPSPEIRALRMLTQERRFYAGIKTSVMRHCYSRLAELGVPYGKGDLQHKSKREKLRKLRASEVDLALDELDDLETRLRTIDARIRVAFSSSEDAKLLKTIPGIGELTAVALAGYLCPIERFPNVDKLTSYVGLCPTVHQSSSTVIRGHLKRDCNSAIRSLLVQTAWRHRVHAPHSDVARLAHRVGQERGKMLASIASTHKLVRIIYAILKQGRPYLARAPSRLASSQQLRGPRPRLAA